MTFSGGSWSNITSLQLARSLKYPDTKTKGNAGYKFAIYSSKHSHYSVEKAAILLGLGAENVFKVNVDEDGVMDVQELEAIIEKLKLMVILHYMLMLLLVPLFLVHMMHLLKLAKLQRNTTFISILMDLGEVMSYFLRNIRID